MKLSFWRGDISGNDEENEWNNEGFCRALGLGKTPTLDCCFDAMKGGRCQIILSKDKMGSFTLDGNGHLDLKISSYRRIFFERAIITILKLLVIDPKKSSDI